jgi:hypothetical protein
MKSNHCAAAALITGSGLALAQMQQPAAIGRTEAHRHVRAGLTQSRSPPCLAARVPHFHEASTKEASTAAGVNTSAASLQAISLNGV